MESVNKSLYWLLNIVTVRENEEWETTRLKHDGVP